MGCIPNFRFDPCGSMYFGGSTESESIRMAKRALEDPIAEALKKVKNDDPEGSWTCPFCQNINWPKRTTCNKEGCHMPRDIGGTAQHPEGSWACTTCNNINWPKRTECKKCRTPRTGQKAAAQPGSWICPTCANLNFPARTMCNKGCGTAKPVSPGIYAQSALPQITQLQLAGLGLEPYLQSLLAQTTNPYLPATSVAVTPAGAHPPGSWECLQCHNVNWPKRTQCNKPNCGAVRPGYEALPAGAPVVHPEGSWSCPGCNNINWPQRTACKKCSAPKPVGL